MEEEIKPHILRIVWQPIASIGWYIVGVAIVLLYLWPHILEKYNTWRNKKDEKEYAEKYYKDSDIVFERLSKIELARQQMQDKYNSSVELAKEKEEENKERKRQQLLKLNEKLDGHRLGNGEESFNSGASTSKPKSRLLKEEYNPLMGGSGSRYRPPKRSCCGKGGCG